MVAKKWQIASTDPAIGFILTGSASRIAGVARSFMEQGYSFSVSPVGEVPAPFLERMEEKEKK